jgi:hypothetical protein
MTLDELKTRLKFAVQEIKNDHAPNPPPMNVAEALEYIEFITEINEPIRPIDPNQLGLF